jgi:biotin transporter BioY|tara:strand:- start:217 stop:681 length:465 start_codon:yes stop_codon:yes gene_type:complete
MIKDIKILGVIIFISLILFGYTFTFDEVPEILAQGMQPTMMPRLIFSLIIFLCFFQIYQNKSLKSENKDIIKRNAFITFGYTLFIVLIADKLGFLISVFLFTLITPILWQRKDYLKITLYSLCMTIFVFVFFTLVLQLKFPQGILEDFIIRNFY